MALDKNLRVNAARCTSIAGLCAVLVLAGCGGSSHGPKATKTPTPAPLSSAKARSLAAAGVLTPADMHGYVARAQAADAADDLFGKKMQDCIGAPPPTYLVRNYGTSFTKGTVEVDSSADVAPSVAAATTQLHAITDPKAGPCFETLIKAALAGDGLTVTSASATPETVTVPGSDGTFGYRLVLRARTQGQTLHVSGYEVGSLVGQVEIEVGDITFGATPVTLADATALLAKVTARVKAAY